MVLCTKSACQGSVLGILNGFCARIFRVILAFGYKGCPCSIEAEKSHGDNVNQT